MKTILLATAPDKEKLVELINKWFCSTSYYIDDEMKLQNSTGKISAERLSHYIIKTAKNGRLQFRMIDDRK